MSGLYVKLDAEYASDDKLIEAGPMAELLYVRGLAFAKRTLTDGHITRRQLAAVGLGIPNAPKHAQRLVEVGAWTETTTGWDIAAWLKRNPSVQQIEADREAKRLASMKGNHEQHHVGPGKKPSHKCELCRPKPEPTSAPTSEAKGSANRLQEEEPEPEPEEKPEPEPEEEPQALPLAPTSVELEPTAPNGARARDPIFDALIDACGYRYDEMTDRQRKACGVARAELARVHATPELIHQRAAIYRQKHPAAALTPNALASQWAALTVNGITTPRLSESSQALARAYQRRQGAP